ncbi:MAG: O-antigen ligase family protein [Parabacteroides sp.]|nr:O-antigen ligase family protein [Parabacteroides sp.]
MTRAAVGLFFIGLFLWFLRLPLKYKLPVLCAAGIVVWILWSPISKIIIASTEMISYRYFTSDVSLHSLFIGGRQYLFDRASAQFVTDGALWYRVVLGGGYFLSFRNPFNLDYSISSILEADLWDVFYMFGIVGLIAYTALFFYGLRFPRGKKRSADYILKIAWIMLFLHSALAGHVLQNGMSVMVLVCILIILKYRSRNESTFSVP